MVEVSNRQYDMYGACISWRVLFRDVSTVSVPPVPSIDVMPSAALGAGDGAPIGLAAPLATLASLGTNML